MKNISDNITYEEAIRSAKAKELGIKNEPSAEVLKCMQNWAVKIFEPTRKHFGNKKLFVSSFFRCAPVNVAIGGSTTSQHVKGEAGDIDGDVYPETASNKQIFEFIRDNLSFDQLIIEGIVAGKIAWVHVSTKLDQRQNRKQILFMYKVKGKTVYEAYSPKRYKELVA